MAGIIEPTDAVLKHEFLSNLPYLPDSCAGSDIDFKREKAANSVLASLKLPWRATAVKILIADDDPITRAMITVPLRASAGVEIVEATNGQEARMLFDKNEFDAVVVDWHMPGMTGLDFTRSIRFTGSRVPILMVTAQSDRKQVVMAIKAGISDYLLKPFDAGVLWDKINRLLGRNPNAATPA
jgi:two-component system chemotaxis response regulator CheY